VGAKQSHSDQTAFPLVKIPKECDHCTRGKRRSQRTRDKVEEEKSVLEDKLLKVNWAFKDL
jgi:hypothetical protein